MSSSIEELGKRLLDLKQLVSQLKADARHINTHLKVEHGVAGDNDSLVALARGCKVPILTPLTIGTLLASALGEIDSVECALKSLGPNEKFGGD